MQYKNEYRRSIDAYRPTIPIRRKIGLYWILAALRIALTIAPQTGYIHPDEYFQSIELISGDHFDIDVYKPWEFNSTFPIRTALIPQVIVGIPYAILKRLSPYTFYFIGVSLRSAYFFIVFPRLLMCALSFVSDYCLYKICCMYGQNYKVRLIIFASSYVILTYATRTLSNNIELLLTSLLLYYTSQCMSYSEKVVIESDILSEKYNKAKNGVERVKYYKLKALLPPHSLNHCFKIATITVIGVFNRPTFPAFAVAPIFFWLQRGLGSKSIGFVDFHIRIFTFVVYSLPTVIMFILLDSFYFGYLTMAEIGSLEINMNNFVVTPLNFLKYNANTKNLENHGLHPRFLHFLVNIPLLYNILGLIGLVTFGKMLCSVLRGRWLDLPRIQSIVGLMTMSFVIPVILLSIFPHQEPRFILPIIMPLAFLYAPNITQIQGTDCVPRTSDNATSKTVPTNRQPCSKLYILWCTCNVALTFFYGFAHQGGMLPLTFHLANELKAKPELTHIHLYTSYSYSIPTALLHLRNTQKTYVSSSKHKYKLTKDFYLYERGSQDMDTVCDILAIRIRAYEDKFALKRIPYRLYYALPASAMHKLIDCSLHNDSKLFNYRIVKTFYPHVATESLPLLRFTNTINLFDTNIFSINSVREVWENLFEFLQQFRLLLLKIEYVKENSKTKT